jgi:acetyltransferase-like isoleucine patch superfamily enzyme
VSTKVAESAIIYPNVILGNDVVVEEYCLIGLPFEGMKDEQTVIGSGSVIRSGTYIYAGNQIGKNFQTGNKANIRELNQIGDNVSIGTLSVIEHHVSIHNGVRIHSQVFIPEYSTLNKNCWLGPNVVITNALYPKHPDVKKQIKGAHIKENAKIGANSTILPGVSIGRDTLIGAGSIVTKDIVGGVIAFGNPAQVIREIDYL